MIKMRKALQILKYLGAFLIAGTLLTLITSSCISEKKRAKICATCPVVIKDSLHTEVMPFDTTLFINRYGQDIALQYSGAYTDLANQLMKLFDQYNDTITTLKNGIRTTIIKTPTKITFKCAADSLEYLLKLERARKNTVKVTTVKVPTICPDCARTHRTGFDNFLRWLFWIWLAVFAIRNLPILIRSVKSSIKNFR